MRMEYLAAGVLAALGLAGCATHEPLFTGSIQPTGAQSIAFESIDGPPKPVFDRLVRTLAAAAAARKLPVVSHTGPAVFRVRAYLATHVEKKQATLSWVWDIFDARYHRAFRLAGEEHLGPARGGDVWAQCDDVTLARVAANSFDALMARLGTEPSSAPAPGSEPARGGPEVVTAGTPRTAAYVDPPMKPATGRRTE